MSTGSDSGHYKRRVLRSKLLDDNERDFLCKLLKRINELTTRQKKTRRSSERKIDRVNRKTGQRHVSRLSFFWCIRVLSTPVPVTLTNHYYPSTVSSTGKIHCHAERGARPWQNSRGLLESNLLRRKRYGGKRGGSLLNYRRLPRLWSVLRVGNMKPCGSSLRTKSCESKWRGVSRDWHVRAR